MKRLLWFVFCIVCMTGVTQTLEREGVVTLLFGYVALYFFLRFLWRNVTFPWIFGVAWTEQRQNDSDSR